MDDLSPITTYLKIQDWAKKDRPREKLLDKGSGALTDAELLGILIGSGTKNMSAVSLAQCILKKHNNDLHTLAKRSVKELQGFKGIGEAKAVTIISAMEISRRRANQTISPKPQINDSHSAYTLIKAELTDKTTEEFWILLLNRANYLIKKIKISSGGISATVVDPKVVFKIAVEYHAAAIIMVHNHPSGNPSPSQTDITMTEKLLEGAKLLDINVIDHIIFTDETYFSFSDEDLMI